MGSSGLAKSALMPTNHSQTKSLLGFYDDDEDSYCHDSIGLSAYTLDLLLNVRPCLWSSRVVASFLHAQNFSFVHDNIYSL